MAIKSLLYFTLLLYFLYIKYNFHIGWSHFLLLVQGLINLGRDLASSSLELTDEVGAVLDIVDLVHDHHLHNNINNPATQTHNLRYRVLHPGLVVVGVGLGSHLEVEGPENSLGEDGVVPDLVPLVGLAKLL